MFRIEARRSRLNALGPLPVHMLCPHKTMICLRIVGTATLNMQTGIEISKDTTETFRQSGEESLSGAKVTFLMEERACKTKAGVWRDQEVQVLLVSPCFNTCAWRHFTCCCICISTDSAYAWYRLVQALHICGLKVPEFTAWLNTSSLTAVHMA